MCCGPAVPPSQAPPTPQQSVAPGQYGMTMLHYHTTDERVFTGATGVSYQFGAERQAAWVDDRDVDVLMTEGAFALNDYG